MAPVIPKSDRGRGGTAFSVQLIQLPLFHPCFAQLPVPACREREQQNQYAIFPKNISLSWTIFFGFLNNHMTHMELHVDHILEYYLQFYAKSNCHLDRKKNCICSLLPNRKNMEANNTRKNNVIYGSSFFIEHLYMKQLFEGHNCQLVLTINYSQLLQRIMHVRQSSISITACTPSTLM